MVAKYRKKPVIIEAVQYTENSRDEVIAWSGAQHTGIGNYGNEYELENLRIHTLEGTLTVSLGDWIIKGIKGEFYPCKPDIFGDTYELVEPLPTEPDPRLRPDYS